MAALTAGARVRVVNRRQPVVGCTGEVVEWLGDAFQVELDGMGMHFFSPRSLNGCATDRRPRRAVAVVGLWLHVLRAEGARVTGSGPELTQAARDRRFLE